MRTRRVIATEEPDARLLQGAMRLLMQMLIAQQRLSGRQAEGLGEAAARLLEEFGAALATGDAITGGDA